MIYFNPLSQKDYSGVGMFVSKLKVSLPFPLFWVSETYMCIWY